MQIGSFSDCVEGVKNIWQSRKKVNEKSKTPRYNYYFQEEPPPWASRVSAIRCTEINKKRWQWQWHNTNPERNQIYNLNHLFRLLLGMQASLWGVPDRTKIAGFFDRFGLLGCKLFVQCKKTAILVRTGFPLISGWWTECDILVSRLLGIKTYANFEGFGKFVPVT